MKRMKVLITFHKVITTMTSMMYGVSQPNIKYIIQTSTINQRHYYHCEGHSSRAVDQDQERREHQVSKLSGPCHKMSRPCHKLSGTMSQAVRGLPQVVRTLSQVVRTLSQVVRALSQVFRTLSQVVRVWA